MMCMSLLLDVGEMNRLVGLLIPKAARVSTGLL